MAYNNANVVKLISVITHLNKLQPLIRDAKKTRFTFNINQVYSCSNYRIRSCVKNYKS